MDDGAEKKLSLEEAFKSIFGLWWFFGALIGAPSLLKIIDAIVIKFDPGLIIEIILDSYDDLRDVLIFLCSPIYEIVVKYLVMIPYFASHPKPYWTDLFVVMAIWISMAARAVKEDYGLVKAAIGYIALILIVAVLVMISSSLDLENKFIEAIWVTVLPVTLFCYMLIIGLALFWPLVSGTGGFLQAALTIAWIPFAIALLSLPGAAVGVWVWGLTTGAGVMNALLLTLIVGAGSAFDAYKSGDIGSAKFFLGMIGPFIGAALLFGLDWLFEVLSSYMIS